eukprot:gnl/TRDRNA2_/TRDRNA2_132960_c0_seq2.p1 gnl/TRDRNA2_/TRDRNA2_132960_c0~~gnl/TRDRNA2_/TRDRNA2_132960_c0_seq2.p1  ORF type:complete len:251 (-),score=13.69 gnl/TRDRNA2_/TRDRNA2_132960_c0_seq2:1-753(-)
MVLGPVGLAYTCSDLVGNGQPDQPGVLRAVRISDGSLAWERQLSQPCNSWPAVGSLRRRDAKEGVDDISVVVLPGAFGESVSVAQLPSYLPGSIFTFVQRKLHELTLWLLRASPIMAQLLWGYPSKRSEIQAYNARTGSLQWRHEIAPYRQSACRGHEENHNDRTELGNWRHELTGPWSSPTIAADGTIYACHQSGVVYAVKDKNGDDLIDSQTEVSTLDIGAACLHFGASFAPGLMGITSFQELFVWHV